MTRLERWSEWLNRHERAAFLGLIAFYILIVVSQTELKLIWADELITFYIAKQPGLSGIWHALQAGADPNPPLMHVLVKVSTSALGANALGMRLPAILSVLLAIVAIWWMLRRWVRPVCALTGVLAFMATRGFDYAYDARSYAPMMGFAMASLALWMYAVDFAGWKRPAALAGMALALAAGISSNYYCVLAFFPIAAGELAAKRFRPGVWLAMAIASLPLALYLPLIHHNIAEFGPHAWNRPHASMIAMSYLELVEGIFWPVLGLAIYAWVPLVRRGFLASNKGLLTRPEQTALTVLLIYPFLGFAIALGGAGMISPRCVAPVCCGIGLAAGVLAQKVFGNSGRAAFLFAATLVLWVVVRESFCAHLLLEQRRSFFALRDHIPDSSGTPILISDSSFVLPLIFYSPQTLRPRFLFPIDFDLIHRFEKDDSGEQNLWSGRDSVFPMPITPLTIPPCDSNLVIIARPDGWLAESLRNRGYALRVTADTTDWDHLGGVFTPMAHPETRILRASHSCPNGL